MRCMNFMIRDHWCGSRREKGWIDMGTRNRWRSSWREIGRGSSDRRWPMYYWRRPTYMRG